MPALLIVTSALVLFLGGSYEYVMWLHTHVDWIACATITAGTYLFLMISFSLLVDRFNL